MRLMGTAACAVTLTLCCAALAQQEGAPAAETPLHCYISTGDHHWMAAALPIDSQASINASFDMLRAQGIRRIYWRGLQEATAIATMHAREENFRYATWVSWARHLIEDLGIERMAVEAAHARGMELWGVGTLGDWGCSADTPGFNDFPWFWESTLRIEHPEWVPVDKYGYRRQGGPIELAYPEARAALVELHADVARRAGYDGVLFITYVENFSMRFQDEFGFSEPIVRDFRRRFGIDIRTDPFTRNANRTDWYKLRGEYVTEYLRALRAALPEGTGLGMFINPRTPRYPQVWSTLGREYHTLGEIYLDLETWVREGIVDQLVVYGASNAINQPRTIEDMLWLTRDTATAVAFNTSSPRASIYEPFAGRVNGAVFAVAEDHHFLAHGGFPEQDESALQSGDLWRQMVYLAQVIEGTSEASTAQVLPFATHENLLMRRQALLALATIGDPEGVPVIEAALRDPENSVRCMAMYALRLSNRPESTAAIVAALDEHHEHPLHEAARDTLARIHPAPLAEIRAAASHPDEVVRTTAIRVLRYLGPTEEDVPLLVERLGDEHRYAAFSAAETLGAVRGSEAAVRALIAATRHPDVAVADRAATSIAEMIARGEPAAEALRGELLAAVRALFEQMGDGCTRSDAEWGYRPAGNALLAFGAEGEAVLGELMAQSEDRRLAELAWRVLMLREKAGQNEFNIVTEQENDEAFRQRPAWLPRLLTPRLSESFDAAARWSETTEGMVGDARRPYGRWGVFGAPGPLIDAQLAHSAPSSVRLVPGGRMVHCYTARAIADERDWQVEAWLQREEGAVLAVEVSGRSLTTTPEAAVRIDEAGRVHLRDMIAGEWLDAGLSIAPGTWTHLRIVANRWRGRFTVELTSEGGAEQNSAVEAPLSLKRGLYLVKFTPEGVGATHLDDVALIERM